MSSPPLNSSPTLVRMQAAPNHGRAARAPGVACAPRIAPAVKCQSARHCVLARPPRPTHRVLAALPHHLQPMAPDGDAVGNDCAQDRHRAYTKASQSLRCATCRSSCITVSSPTSRRSTFTQTWRGVSRTTESIAVHALGLGATLLVLLLLLLVWLADISPPPDAVFESLRALTDDVCNNCGRGNSSISPIHGQVSLTISTLALLASSSDHSSV